MKMKMSMIAAAMAMSFSGLASASVQLGSTGDGELLLSVWDNTTNVSYTRGLGIDMNTFMADAGITMGTTTAGFTASGDTAAMNFTLAADANMTSFLSGVAAGDSLEWNVVAYDTTGTNGYNGTKYLMTSTAALSDITSTQTNINTVNMKLGDGSYVSTVNALIGGVAMDTGSAIATSADGLAYAAGFGNSFGDNMGGKTNFGTTTGTALGESLNFFLLTPSSTLTQSKAFAYQFGNTAGVSSWTLGTNGMLSYSIASVAAVPEPGEWALMLSGFGLIGFIATRRRKLSGNGMSFA
jgi:hypothetical protein